MIEKYLAAGIAVSEGFGNVYYPNQSAHNNDPIVLAHIKKH